MRSGTRIQAVMEDIQSRIAARTYLPGTRLPSVRAQAQAMQVSVSTVVEAYERLAAEGVIASRPGSGFYVAGPVAPLALGGIGPRVDRRSTPCGWPASRCRQMPTRSSRAAAGCRLHGCTRKACAARCAPWRARARWS